MSAAYGEALRNAAVEPDGVELDFQGDRCGKSYRIKKNCIGNWEVFFNDWREGGWFDFRDYGRTRHEAIQNCNEHAIKHRLIKFLPTRPKFKLRLHPFYNQALGAAGSTGLSAAAGSAISAAASVAGLSL